MTTANTPVIDAQVHAYERDHPARPWAGHLAGPSEVTGDDMVAAMDAVGVDGAILISPWSLYRYDASYVCAVYEKHPTRFGLVKPFDHTAPDVEDQVHAWAATPGAVGVRVVLLEGPTPAADDAGIAAIMRAAAAHDLPVNMLVWDRLPFFADVARRYDGNRLVLDHLGIRQPFYPPVPENPFAALPEVVKLAAFQHVAIKITGAGTLSQQPFPYLDIRRPLEALFEAFGLDRCLWGTDWTRATEFLDYQQGVEAFRAEGWLSQADRAQLMGGSLVKVYRWGEALLHRHL